MALSSLETRSSREGRSRTASASSSRLNENSLTSVTSQSARWRTTSRIAVKNAHRATVAERPDALKHDDDEEVVPQHEERSLSELRETAE